LAKEAKMKVSRKIEPEKASVKERPWWEPDDNLRGHKISL
jgi:hypothetical protein